MELDGRIPAVASASGAIAVGAGAVLWMWLVEASVPVGFLVTLAFGAAAAVALTGVAFRLVAERSVDIDRMVDAIRSASDGGRLRPVALPDEPRLAEVARGVNALLANVQASWDGLARDAELARRGIDASPDGLMVVGTDGLIRYVNPAFRSMIPMNDTATGRTPIEAVHAVEVEDALEEALAQGASAEIPCSQSPRDLLVRAVRTEDGGAVVVVQDVTAFRRAERTRTEFVANVSHELRTPIATIMGYAETLDADRDRLDPETAMMAQAIHRNAVRLRDLFEDLLELSRIELRRRELPLVLTRLRPIVERAVVPTVDGAARRRQEVVIQMPDALEAAVNAEALVTVIANLARNASNYTPEGGHIVISARRESDEVILDVKDDGIGIDRAHHERIFERFYRVDEGRSRKVGGTGLGLAIVKHLCLASNARVTVQSELGKGSTFTVHLPARLPPWQR